MHGKRCTEEPVQGQPRRIRKNPSDGPQMHLKSEDKPNRCGHGDKIGLSRPLKLCKLHKIHRRGQQLKMRKHDLQSVQLLRPEDPRRSFLCLQDPTSQSLQRPLKQEHLRHLRNVALDRHAQHHPWQQHETRWLIRYSTHQHGGPVVHCQGNRPDYSDLEMRCAVLQIRGESQPRSQHFQHPSRLMFFH